VGQIRDRKEKEQAKLDRLGRQLKKEVAGKTARVERSRTSCGGFLNKSSLAEKSTGNGAVLRGQQIVSDVHYEVRVYEKYDEALLLAGSKVRTAIAQSVRIFINGTAGMNLGERLTLQLSDGRKVDFYLTSPDGDCVGTGPFY